MPRVLAAVGLAATLAIPTDVPAADHQILMLNKDSEGRLMQFEPAFLKVAPGDTVTFVAQDMTHNSESFAGKIPEGAEAWKGKINEEVSVTLSEPGVYMYQCTPHLGMGMIGAIVVGEPTNLEAVKGIKYPGKSKAAAEEIFAEIERGG